VVLGRNQTGRNVRFNKLAEARLVGRYAAHPTERAGGLKRALPASKLKSRLSTKRLPLAPDHQAICSRASSTDA